MEKSLGTPQIWDIYDIILDVITIYCLLWNWHRLPPTPLQTLPPTHSCLWQNLPFSFFGSRIQRRSLHRGGGLEKSREWQYLIDLIRISEMELSSRSRGWEHLSILWFLCTSNIWKKNLTVFTSINAYHSTFTTTFNWLQNYSLVWKGVTWSTPPPTGKWEGVGVGRRHGSERWAAKIYLKSLYFLSSLQDLFS